MREIEFRAYLKKNKQIVDVLDIDFIQETIGYMNKSDTKYTCVKFDDIELMQYTGLKDKNGKKIFEGDIVRKITYGKMADISKYEDAKAFKKHKRYLIKHSKCIFDTEYEYHQNRDYKVEWYLNGFYPFADSPENCRHCGGAIDSDKIEVIGNIYDNPELLEEQVFATKEEAEQCLASTRN